MMEVKLSECQNHVCLDKEKPCYGAIKAELKRKNNLREAELMSKKITVRMT